MPEDSRQGAAMPLDAGSVHSDRSGQWSLAAGLSYLNHGSFGPAPRPVLAAQDRWIAELQKNPMEFFVRRLDRLLDEAAVEVAKFAGCAAKDLIFVPNATYAMNIVADNVRLDPGDEVLLNDHEYGAVLRIWRRHCEQLGAKVVVASLPRPIERADAVVEALFERVCERTKLIVLSHVTSPTATVLPVEQVCAQARRLGIPVCIDGPHAVAMRPLKIDDLACDFYCASGHKWLSGPFGSGFLYVCGARKSNLRPPLLSWGRSLSGRPSTWKDEFHWSGTYQPAPFLALPAAVQFLQDVGLDNFRKVTHSLAQHARERLIAEVDGEPLTPPGNDWYGSMVTVRLPWVRERASHPGATHSIQDLLHNRFQIEVPIVEWGDAVHVRVSCHLYNDESDIDRLIEALRAIRDRA